MRDNLEDANRRISELAIENENLRQNRDSWMRAANQSSEEVVGLKARIAELEEIQKADAETIDKADREEARLMDQVAGLEQELERGEERADRAYREKCVVDQRLRETRATLDNTRRALKAALRMEST